MGKKITPKTKVMKVRYSTFETIQKLANANRRSMIEQTAILVELATQPPTPPTQPQEAQQ